MLGIFTCMVFHFARYNETEEISVGPFYFPGKDNNMTMCVTKYKNLRPFPYKPNNPFDTRTLPPECYTELPAHFDIKSYLESKGERLQFTTIARITLSMTLNTVYLNGISHSNLPDCLKFAINIKFDNSKGDGQMCVNLYIKGTPLPCNGNEGLELFSTNGWIYPIIILCSLISIVIAIMRLCCAYKLRGEVNVALEKKEKEKRLSITEQFSTFCDMWDITVIITSSLAVTGVSLKIYLEVKREFRSTDNYNNCAIVLGTAAFMAWTSMVRYLKYSKDGSIVLETIKIVFFRIIWLLLCVGFMFVGFFFCGWLALGPYNAKYKYASSTSDTLFALANGDDITRTFQNVDSDETAMWYFNRFFLVFYIVTFLIVVVNVAIAIFNDGYEKIRNFYKKRDKGEPVNKIEEFLFEEPAIKKDLYVSWCTFKDIFCCCRKKGNEENPSVENVNENGQRPDSVV